MILVRYLSKTNQNIYMYKNIIQTICIHLKIYCTYIYLVYFIKNLKKHFTNLII